LDLDADTVVKIKVCVKTRADQTLEREKNVRYRYVFQLENFFLCRTDIKTHMNAMRGTILKNVGSNTSVKIRI
jgi:hypothetical protein